MPRDSAMRVEQRMRDMRARAADGAQQAKDFRQEARARGVLMRAGLCGSSVNVQQVRALRSAVCGVQRVVVRRGEAAAKRRCGVCVPQAVVCRWWRCEVKRQFCAQCSGGSAGKGAAGAAGAEGRGSAGSAGRCSVRGGGVRWCDSRQVRDAVRVRRQPQFRALQCAVRARDHDNSAKECGVAVKI